jgi:hypothetical protein
MESSMSIKKLLVHTALGAMIGAGALAVTATSASAYVACNRHGDCWHTNDHVFAPHFGVTVHDNNWRWRGRDHYRWREHRGHGYWRSGVWINL